MRLTVGDTIFTATLENNSSAGDHAGYGRYGNRIRYVPGLGDPGRDFLAAV